MTRRKRGVQKLGVKRGANASGVRRRDGSLIRDPQKRVRQPFSQLPVTKPDGGTRDVNYKALIGNPSLLLLAYTRPCHPSETAGEEKRNIESIVVSRATILVVTRPESLGYLRLLSYLDGCSRLWPTRSVAFKGALVFLQASTRFRTTLLGIQVARYKNLPLLAARNPSRAINEFACRISVSAVINDQRCESHLRK